MIEFDMIIYYDWRTNQISNAFNWNNIEIFDLKSSRNYYFFVSVILHSKSRHLKHQALQDSFRLGTCLDNPTLYAHDLTFVFIANLLKIS